MGRVFRRGFRLPEVVDKFGETGLGVEMGHGCAFLWVGMGDCFCLRILPIRQPENE